MALLAKGGNNFSDEFKQVAVNTELLVCPTCGREVPPWIMTCPDDGTPVLAQTQMSASGPAVPAHLLDDIDETGSAELDQDAPADEAPDDEVSWPG